MKASLLARSAMALLLAAGLAGGTATAAFAATATTAAAGTDTNAAATAPGTAQANTAGGTAAAAPGTQPATPENLEQIAQQRIADLHAQLNITAKQEASWNKFARVMRANARELDQAYEQRAQQFDSMNAVDNMKSYAKIEKMRARDVQKLVPAFDSLYASLTPAQKQQADTLFRNRAEAAQQKRENATANR